MLVHGAIIAESPDCQKETVSASGADCSALKGLPLTWGFQTCKGLWDAWPTIAGEVIGTRLITSPDECLCAADERLWIAADKSPLVKVVAEISSKMPEGPRTIEMLNNDGMRGWPFFAVGGTVLERIGGTVTRCVLKEVALTLRGVHPAYLVRGGDGR